MIWSSDAFSIFKDKVVQHEIVAQAISEGELISNYKNKINTDQKIPPLSWKLSKDIREHPQFHSSFSLLVTLYNMSLEEMEENIEPDRTFRTGAEWVGVWTRDISYSVILSLAVIQPEICRISLLRKIQNKRIVQDTGTGGAYPVSTDRVVWAIAAWEIYKVTGSKNWLEESFEIVKNTIEDDLKNVFNPVTGLYKGESSFLDWREQTYPRWMEPVDIYESESLGTNIVHYKALSILSEMASDLGKKDAQEKYNNLALKLKEAINKNLWIEEKGYYAQFLYGRKFKILSPRAEALGEALAVLYEVADTSRQKKVVSSTPVNKFGIPSIYPQIPDIPAYHNNGVWPFVQAFWTLAAAKVQNEKAVITSLSALIRAAALFLTNKENFVAHSGNDDGTVFNSDRQLWSVAGTLGVVYKVLFGIGISEGGLIFNPFVPKKLEGQHKLTNFKFRNATFTIELEGYGKDLKNILLDGNALNTNTIPADLEGDHDIKLILDNSEPEDDKINMAKDYFSPSIPEVNFSEGKLKWKTSEKVKHFIVIKNGKEYAVTENTEVQVESDGYAEYQVKAVDKEGFESFASEPLSVGIQKAQQIYEIENQVKAAEHPFEGFSGSGFIETTKKINKEVKIEVEIEESGNYAIDFRYSNGNGPINTDNKCAIRTLKIDEQTIGTIVMPQRGINEWSNWGFSNSVIVQLEEGHHILLLTFEPDNENMNSEINEAMLDYMRMIKLSK